MEKIKEFFRKVKMVLCSNLVTMPFAFVLMFLWQMPEILIWNHAFQGLVPTEDIVLSAIDCAVKILVSVLLWKKVLFKDQM